jgi:hypothetical protein
VSHRQSQLLRVLAGQRHDLRQLLGRELARAAAAVLVREHREHHLLQLLVPHLGRGGRRELLLGCRPAPAPASDKLLVDTEEARLRGGRLAIGRPQHHLDPFSQPALDGTRPCQPLKNRPLPWRENDGGSPSTHSSTLILAILGRKFSP